MKFLKRVTAICLIFCLIAVSLIPAASAAYTQDIPHVGFRGFMSYTIYADKDDPNSEQIFPLQRKKVLQSTRELVPALRELSKKGDWNRFGDIFIPMLNSLLSPIGFSENGTPDNNSGVHFTYPTKEEVVANKLNVEFIYDWRADPYESAAKLNDFILYLTEELGYPQVVLESHSYAGIVMLTYLSTYGTEKVRSCCFNSTAVFGAQFAGELVKGNVAISHEVLMDYLKCLFDSNEFELILSGVIDILSSVGLIDFAADFISNLFLMLSDRLWTQSILPNLGFWPSVWAMVPDRDFDEGYDHVFRTLYGGKDIDLSGLQAKIAAYNTDIRQNRKARLQAINDSDTNVYVIARYGYPGVPLGNIWAENTDTVLNSAAEAFGATCMRYDFEISTAPVERYISPNGAIDASSCLFPDQTWFIRDCKHSQKGAALEEFTHTLLFSASQATIDTYEAYPQYLLFEGTKNGVVPDSNAAYVKNLFFGKLVGFLRKVARVIADVFVFLFHLVTFQVKL